MDALDETALLDLEHRGWEALCTGNGGDFYGSLMTPAAVMVLVNGWVLDREAVRQSLNESPPWSGYDLSDTRLVPVSAGSASSGSSGSSSTVPGSAALVYRARAWRDGEAPFEALMASTYTIVDGRLRLALYQQTTITH